MKQDDIKAIFFVATKDLTQFSNFLFSKGCFHTELPADVLQERLRAKNILVVTEKYSKLKQIPELTSRIYGVPMYIIGNFPIDKDKLNSWNNYVLTDPKEWNLFNYVFSNFNQTTFDAYLSN